MRRALLKTAFVLAVLSLMIVFLIPASVVMDQISTMRPGPSGHYRGDRLFPGIVVLTLCLCLADRIISSLFRAGRLTEERWSIFDNGHRRRSR